jgi:opacity protein-like surface antigen
MKISLKNLCVFVFSGLLIASPIFSQSKFSIRLTGGLSTIDGGDLNDDIREFHKFASYLNGNPVYSASLDLDEMNSAFNFGGELVYNIKNRFSIGLETEYLTRTVEGLFSLDYSTSTAYWWGTGIEGWNEMSTRMYTLRAIPILLNLYYSIPLGNKTSIILNLGSGYYFGSFGRSSDYEGGSEYEEESWYYLDYLYEYSYSGVEKETSNAATFGFHGGIGIDINLTSHIGLIIEARGRMVNFKDWEGDYRDRWNWEESEWLETQGTIFGDNGSEFDKEAGKLWLIAFPDEMTDETYKRIGVWEEKPETTLRQAEINLNGITLRAGIKIQF